MGAGHSRGESFRLHLDGYFTEQQLGRSIDIVLEYGYTDVLPLTSMPDYRLIQLLVEEVLYIYPEEWINIFWEMANRELVRRLLDAFPAISWVRSEMLVRPTDLLPIKRTSVVDWHRKDLPSLGQGLAPFLRPLPDACYYAAPPTTFNIGAPRYLLASLTQLYERLAPHAAEEGGVYLSFIPTCRAATEGTYDETLNLASTFGAYDALILPRRAKHDLERLTPVGSLTGIVEVVSGSTSGGSAESGSGVAEHLLHSLLGSPSGYAAAAHAGAREAFFFGRARRMLLEAPLAAALTLRGHTAMPAFEGEPLELCVPKASRDAPRVVAAIARVQAASS